jgi:hypothetical protein
VGGAKGGWPGHGLVPVAEYGGEGEVLGQRPEPPLLLDDLVAKVIHLIIGVRRYLPNEVSYQGG